MPICFNTLKGYQKRFNWYFWGFQKFSFHWENRREGSQKGYHCMWKSPILILSTGMKTLKVLIEKVRISQHWFLPVFSLEHLEQCSVYDPAKIFFASKFSYVLFCNPIHNIETGTTNRCGTTNSKPPGPISLMANQKHWVVRSYYYTLFCRRP